jgi:acyl carrier protein
MEAKDKILQEVTEIFKKELDDKQLVVNYDSSPNTIERWDSVSNLVLISAMEEKFDIIFPVEFIFSADKVEDFCDYILKNSTRIN